jgi:REP element-mobilizing transposase RayT
MAYRRLNLPHLHPIGASFSILLLVEDAVPKPLLAKFQAERLKQLQEIRSNRFPGWQRALGKAQGRLDRQFDRLLARHADQSHPLSHPRAAELLVERIKKYDGKYYELYAYSVMSNHAHLELDFSIQLPAHWSSGHPIPGYVNVAKAMNLIKGGSARYINQELGRTNKPLWAPRYRDRFIRSEKHLDLACAYTRNNPVVAGLVTDWRDHPFTGGMSLEEITARRDRRFYPDAKLWIERLKKLDRESRKG